jgi:hypothetical protein
MIFLVLLPIFVLFRAFIRRVFASLMDGVAPILANIDNPQLPRIAEAFLLSVLQDRYYVRQGSKYFLSTEKFNMSCMGSKCQSLP